MALIIKPWRNKKILVLLEKDYILFKIPNVKAWVRCWQIPTPIWQNHTNTTYSVWQLQRETGTGLAVNCSPFVFTPMGNSHEVFLLWLIFWQTDPWAAPLCHPSHVAVLFVHCMCKLEMEVNSDQDTFWGDLGLQRECLEFLILFVLLASLIASDSWIFCFANYHREF